MNGGPVVGVLQVERHRVLTNVVTLSSHIEKRLLVTWCSPPRPLTQSCVRVGVGVGVGDLLLFMFVCVCVCVCTRECVRLHVRLPVGRWVCLSVSACV